MTSRSSSSSRFRTFYLQRSFSYKNDMRVIWIVLIAFTFALISPGNSLPSRYPKEANVSPVLSLVSDKHRPKSTTDAFTGTGSYAADGKQPSNKPRGTQKGIVDSKELLKKKVVHFLKLRPGLLASLSRALEVVGDRSSKVKHAQLNGSPAPKSIHEKLNNQIQETDDQVIIGMPELKGAGIKSQKTSEPDNQEIFPKASLNHKKIVKRYLTKNPFSGQVMDSFKSTREGFKLGSDERRHKWDSEHEDMDAKSEDKLSGSKDMQHEAQTEELSGTHTDWDSRTIEGMDSGSRRGEQSGLDNDWDSRVQEESIKKADTYMDLALEHLLRKLNRKILVAKSTDDRGTASEQETARSPKDKRYASRYADDFKFDNSETESSGEPFSPPLSDIRWIGTSLADTRSFNGVLSADEGTGTNEQNGGGISNGTVTLLVLGGLFFLLLMVAFFVFAWPIREYYKEKYRRMFKGDVHSARDDDKAPSIRVDSGPRTDCQYTPSIYYPPPQPTHQEPSSAPYNGPDFRNMEKRKIIKRQSFQTRHSLADSLLIAKSVIDGYAKNKEFERKASERRRVIKCCNSAHGSDAGKRRMSFVDELQEAQSVIVPEWDYKESLERSKEKCRTIKDTFAGKRRPSLLEEIGVAKDVIVDSEKRKHKLPPAVVEEMLLARIASGGPMEYYGDIVNKLFKENRELKRRRASTNTPTTAAEQQSMVENEVLWYDDRF